MKASIIVLAAALATGILGSPHPHPLPAELEPRDCIPWGVCSVLNSGKCEKRCKNLVVDGNWEFDRMVKCGLFSKRCCCKKVS